MIDTITNILTITILYSSPLILAGIGGLYSERSGVVNIGLEGLMIIGAFTAAVGTYFTGNAYISLILAVIAGIVLSIPHAVATITLKADQVVSGIAINFLAFGLSMYLIKFMFDGAGQTPQLPDQLNKLAIPYLKSIPIIGTPLFNNYITTYIAFIVVVVTSFILYRTKFGIRLRAVGEHPHALQTAGVSVVKMRYMAVMISGALASLGGAGYTIAIGSEFSATTIAGQGFISLAALIFGNWKPYGVLGAALFFGFSVSLTLTGQVIGLTEYIPSEVLNMTPYFLTILALAGFVGRSSPPRALGKAYNRGTR